MVYPQYCPQVILKQSLLVSTSYVVFLSDTVYGTITYLTKLEKGNQWTHFLKSALGRGICDSSQAGTNAYEFKQFSSAWKEMESTYFEEPKFINHLDKFGWF